MYKIKVSFACTVPPPSSLHVSSTTRCAFPSYYHAGSCARLPSDSLLTSLTPVVAFESVAPTAQNKRFSVTGL